MTKGLSHHVVVGVDGSPNSVAALHLAMSEARRRHAALDVVYVIRPDASDAQVSGATDMLEEIMHREFPEGPQVVVQRHVQRGDPAPMLLNASFDATLLVLGARETAGHCRPFGFKTVSRCQRSGHCPVKISHPGP